MTILIIKKLRKFANTLKSGDYVLINCKDYNVNNEVMILSGEPSLHSEGFTIVAYKLGSSENTAETFYDYEIVKKLTPQEAELYIATNKYNL